MCTHTDRDRDRERRICIACKIKYKQPVQKVKKITSEKIDFLHSSHTHKHKILQTMRRMMQSMVRQLEYYKFNALLILLTFLTHEQYFRVLGITVDPLDSLPTSSTPYADQYVGSSEVHDLNNIDYNQFINGPKSYAGSSEPVSKSQASVKCVRACV